MRPHFVQGGHYEADLITVALSHGFKARAFRSTGGNMNTESSNLIPDHSVLQTLCKKKLEGRAFQFGLENAPVQKQK